ncbi:MAG: DUF2156 domain-containing protein [Dehalococcoidia bacterium]|nr:DUF2156 domain-containing protein [Dehalococcoidia bacterium]
MPHERAEVRELLEEYGGSSLDAFKYWPGKAYVFDPSRRGVAAYSISAGCAIALGDPIGDPGSAQVALDHFLKLCNDNGWSPAFHQVPPDMLPAYLARGMQVLKDRRGSIGRPRPLRVGDLREQVVPLPAPSLRARGVYPRTRRSAPFSATPRRT